MELRSKAVDLEIGGRAWVGLTSSGGRLKRDQAPLGKRSVDSGDRDAVRGQGSAGGGATQQGKRDGKRPVAGGQAARKQAPQKFNCNEWGLAAI